MKVTVINDEGERKDYEFDGIALAGQTGKNTISFIDGKCDTVQWVCIIRALDNAKKNIEGFNPSIKFLSALSMLDTDEIDKGLNDNDKS